jgi:DNA-binding MarR family transcriptional regulator
VSSSGAVVVPRSVERDLSGLLARAAHALNVRLSAELAVIDSSPRAHGVLLHALESERSQTVLAQIGDLDKTTMVVLMDDLERRGLAERKPSPTDRRARIVVVTPAGAELVRRGVEIVDRVHGEALDGLAGDRDVFLRSLSGLLEGETPPGVPGRRAPRRPRS